MNHQVTLRVSDSLESIPGDLILIKSYSIILQFQQILQTYHHERPAEFEPAK